MQDPWTEAVIQQAIENDIPISEAPHFVKLAQLAEAGSKSEAFAAGVADVLMAPRARSKQAAAPVLPKHVPDPKLEQLHALMPFDSDAFIEGFASKCAEAQLGPQQIQQALAVYIQKSFGKDDE
jgi:uncharacterized protein YbaA (DUF1428 family)